MSEKTPQGVIIFGILHILYSTFTFLSTIILVFLAGLGLMLIGNIAEGSPEAESAVLTTIVLIGAILALGSLVLSSLGIISAIGALIGKEWARKMLLLTVIILLALEAIQSLLNLVSVVFGSSTSGAIGFIFNLIIIAYFVLLINYFKKDEVRDWFLKKTNAAKKDIPSEQS